MCYSTKERQDYRAFVRRYGAALAIDEFVSMMRQRERADEVGFKMTVAAEMVCGLIDHLAGTAAAREIEQSDLRWKARKRKQLEFELIDALEEFRAAQEKLKIRWSETAQKNEGVKSRKVARLRKALSDLDAHSRDDYRIFPLYFGPLIIEDAGKRLIVPARFRILQKNGTEIPNDFQVFNARRDSLQDKKTWKPLFGAQHGILPFDAFYEKVEMKDGSIAELEFTPRDQDGMHAACVYQISDHPELGKIVSYALLTDTPPRDVAEAGHDRCPIFIADRVIDKWLNPKGQSQGELDALLDEKESTHYLHTNVAA